ncbi:nitrite transporter [Mycobacterium tuberculosis]|nr:nitrite transporter [Mycobacterium tuberculosis]
MSIDLEKYLDVVWVSGGRQFPELDCYGVVNEVRRDLFLPLWAEHVGATRDDLPDLARAATLQHAGSDLVEGAVAFCYEGSVVTHVAVLVQVDGRMCTLECNDVHNVTVLPVSRFERRFNKVEYYA